MDFVHQHDSTIAMSLIDLSRNIGANWSIADPETKKYCVKVAKLIKDRHAELDATISSSGPGSTTQADYRPEIEDGQVHANHNDNFMSVSAGLIDLADRITRENMEHDTLMWSRSLKLRMMRAEIMALTTCREEAEDLADRITRENMEHERMMRVEIMALTTCREEVEASSMISNIPAAPPPFCLPYCQLVQNECSVVGMLCLPTIDSSHRRPSDEEVLSRNVAKYNIDELSVDDAVILDMWSKRESGDKALGEMDHIST